jgi:anti-sigma regulatory factor (Ser/Thr protein kinase)
VQKQPDVEAAAPYALAFVVLVAVALALVSRRRSFAPAAVPAPSVPDGLLRTALLPAQPPIVDGLRLSWSYLPASAPAAAGGDFTDAFFLDDGTLAVAIGHAEGGGLAALAAMNVVRQALRGALLDGARPGEALRRANRVLLRSERPGIVTALAAIADPATLQFRYASAGHPAPLLARADGGCAPLPGAGSGIVLGTVPHHVTSEYVAALPDDGVLALYTEGCLIDAGDVATGEGSLADALVVARTLAPARLAPTIEGALFGAQTRRADATIFTIAPEAQVAHLDVRLPAEPASAGPARTALRRFLASTPLPERRSFDALVAAGEAVANAIDHAYDRRPNQTFVLRARYEERACTIVVEDAGTWSGGDPATAGGRGIALMRELCDDFEITRTPHGTSVLLGFLIAANVADEALVRG